jgi:hypothetical protein
MSEPPIRSVDDAVEKLFDLHVGVIGAYDGIRQSVRISRCCSWRPST